MKLWTTTSTVIEIVLFFTDQKLQIKKPPIKNYSCIISLIVFEHIVFSQETKFSVHKEMKTSKMGLKLIFWHKCIPVHYICLAFSNNHFLVYFFAKTIVLTHPHAILQSFCVFSFFFLPIFYLRMAPKKLHHATKLYNFCIIRLERWKMNYFNELHTKMNYILKWTTYFNELHTKMNYILKWTTYLNELHIKMNYILKWTTY